MRTLTAQRRDATGVDLLHNCVLRRIDGDGASVRPIDTAGEWYATLTGRFGLNLDDLGPDTRARLWARTRAAHEAWRAGRRLRR